MEVTSGIMVKPIHMRRAKGGKGYCVGGSRKWAAFHGIDLHKFAREGIPVEVMEATGDKMALDAAAEARKDHG